MNCDVRSFASSFCAFSSSNCSCAFSTRVTMSPIPRIRLAIRSGWNTSSASSFSPTPTNLIGFETTERIESAAPPLVSPSSFVSTIPSKSSRSWNAFAEFTASWPVIESTTKRISCGLTFCLMVSTSRIISSSTWRRPAVSMMTTSRAPFRAWSIDSVAMSTAPAVPHGVHGDLDLTPEHLELVDGRRPVDVRGHEEREPALRPQVRGELRRERGLARSLEPRDQDHGRRHGREIDRRRRRPHQRDELVVDDLDDELARRQAPQHFLADGLLLDLVDEILDDLVIDVGVQEDPADLTERFGNVRLGNLPFPAKFLEDDFQLLSQIFKHEWPSGVEGTPYR